MFSCDSLLSLSVLHQTILMVNMTWYKLLVLVLKFLNNSWLSILVFFLHEQLEGFPGGHYQSWNATDLCCAILESCRRISNYYLFIEVKNDVNGIIIVCNWIKVHSSSFVRSVVKVLFLTSLSKVVFLKNFENIN